MLTVPLVHRPLLCLVWTTLPRKSHENILRVHCLCWGGSWHPSPQNIREQSGQMIADGKTRDCRAPGTQPSSWPVMTIRCLLALTTDQCSPLAGVGKSLRHVRCSGDTVRCPNPIVAVKNISLCCWRVALKSQGDRVHI